MTDEIEDRMIETLVMFTIEVDGQIVIVENVPARVEPETGEQLFSADTVDRLQQILRSGREPDRMVETPVFRFAA